jgi:very-short-patch-repair endonuclease
MKDRPGIPTNPTDTIRKLNPALYAHIPKGSKMPRSFEAIPAQGSPLEEQFVSLWTRFDDRGDYPFSREWEFSGHRRFKFDFAWPSRHVAVETDGGIFQKGRHNRAEGFARDCEKTNLAVLEGWAVFRLCTGQVTEERVWRIFEFIKAR